MNILSFPWWRTRAEDVQSGPIEPFKPSASVIRGYADDIAKHGCPLDSGLPSYFRRCADYYDSNDQEGDNG